MACAMTMTLSAAPVVAGWGPPGASGWRGLGALAISPRCHHPPLPFPFLPSQVLSSRGKGMRCPPAAWRVEAAL